MKIKTENKSSQTALRCARMGLKKILSRVRSIALQGAFGRTAEDESECRGRRFDRSSLLCAELRSIAHGLQSIAITGIATYGAERELEERD
jgi:hypothetical protein